VYEYKSGWIPPMGVDGNKKCAWGEERKLGIVFGGEEME
jgi:hypothetical protein